MATLDDAGSCFSCGSRICRFARNDGHHSKRRTIHLRRGDRLEACRDGCVKLWTVVAGTAAITTNLRDGRRQISGIERTGSTICGPMAHEDSTIWLEALEACEICETDFSDDMPVLQNDPAFMQALFAVIHERLEAANRHLTTLGRLDSTERVTLFLAEVAETAARPGPVHLPMSRDEIADYLGLNTETVSRIMSKLRKAGLFKFLNRNEFVVQNPEAVARRLPVRVARRPHRLFAAEDTPGGTTGCPVPHDPPQLPEQTS